MTSTSTPLHRRVRRARLVLLSVPLLVVGLVPLLAPSPAAAVSYCAGEPATIEVTPGPNRPSVINGTPGKDVIVGSSGGETINGGGGNDIICAGGGNDVVDGGSGNDQIYGQSGADTLNGGPGADLVNGGGGNDRLNGGSGNDRILGGVGTDNMNGGIGTDHLDGGRGTDTFKGSSGTDTCRDRSGENRTTSSCEVECWGGNRASGLGSFGTGHRTFSCLSTSEHFAVYFNDSLNSVSTILAAQQTMEDAHDWFNYADSMNLDEPVGAGPNFRIQVTVADADALFIPAPGYSPPGGRIQYRDNANLSNRHFLAHEVFHQFQWRALSTGYFTQVGTYLTNPAYLESMAEAAADDFISNWRANLPTVACHTRSNCRDRVQQMGWEDSPWDPAYRGSHAFEYLQDRHGASFARVMTGYDRGRGDAPPGFSLSYLDMKAIEGFEDVAGTTGAVDYWAWVATESAFRPTIMSSVRGASGHGAADARASTRVTPSAVSWTGNRVSTTELSVSTNRDTLVTNTGTRSLVYSFIPCPGTRTTSTTVTLHAQQSRRHTRTGCSTALLIVGGRLGIASDVGSVSLTIAADLGGGGGPR